jgi:hypothetical protein
MSLENRLRDEGKGNPPGERTQIQTELARELAQEESALAQALREGRAQEIITERKLRIARIAEELKQVGGVGGVGGEKGKRPEHWTVINCIPTRDANGEYDSFNDAYRAAQLEVQRMAATQTEKKRWTVVNGKPLEDPEGEYDSFAQAYKVASLEATKAVEQIKAELKISENVDKGFVQTLQAEVASLREDLKNKLDPVWIIQRAAELTETFKAAGLIRETPASGESIESLKERNRHDEKLQELKLQEDATRERNKLFVNAPQMVGGAIAKGLRDRGGVIPGGAVAQEAGKRKQHVVEANQGDVGEITCPDCGEAVGIGPTARVAVCAKCGAKFSVKRIEKPAQVEPEPE